jgi:Ni/Co efflux regulator RcnB
MRKLIAAALIAASVVPAAAIAQSPAELARDRQDIREQRRDLNRAYVNGDRRDVRDARHDLREARQEYREDARDARRNWGRDDWRAYRETNRPLYARGGWRAPFGYTSFRPGVRIAPSYFGPRYVIADPWRYHLPAARGATRWVRHYDDVLLIDYRRGVVVDVIRGFYR